MATNQPVTPAVGDLVFVGMSVNPTASNLTLGQTCPPGMYIVTGAPGGTTFVGVAHDTNSLTSPVAGIPNSRIVYRWASS